ncbi:MAG: DNA polymerase IV [Methylobacteriaceae bacterium]|nr:DNA polymerase IV [Methylobacteriaceae bacterium]
MPSTAYLCRDCLHEAAGKEVAAARCPACGSPRRLSHPERDALSIAHVDCDAFYATVEKRDDPSLRDQPVIIGGGRRGVVATACYIARTYGVKSAMPMFKALKACPQAVVVPPDMGKYARVGRQVRALMLELTPLVEPLSIDEAFLDLAGTRRLHGASPAVLLARFSRRIEEEIGITVSIGLSYCKFLAKLASDLDKPRGFSIIGRAEASAFLADKPVGVIWGIGNVAQARLASDGIRLICDLQRMDEADLIRRYGPEGSRLWRLARGLDARRVSAARETKGISAETTFEADIADAETLTRILYGLCERVSRRLKNQELSGCGVTMKLKTSEFRLLTRSRSGLAPTQLTARIFAAARELLTKAIDGTHYRLIGVGISDLRPADEADRGDLVDETVAREKATEAAVDRLRERFGQDAIVSGLIFDSDRDRHR